MDIFMMGRVCGKWYVFLVLKDFTLILKKKEEEMRK